MQRAIITHEQRCRETEEGCLFARVSVGDCSGVVRGRWCLMGRITPGGKWGRGHHRQKEQHEEQQREGKSRGCR